MKKHILIITVFITLSLIGGSVKCNTHINNSTISIGGTINHVVINEVCYNVSNPDVMWFELYNPTDQSINIDPWEIFFYAIDGSIPMPSAIIKSKEYIIVCKSTTVFLQWWGVPLNTTIIQPAYWGDYWDRICLTDSNGNHPDIVPTNGMVKFPHNALNHSWSRYKGGLDTDDFNNDFYDEPTPTPGAENSREKPLDVVFYGMVIGVPSAIVLAVAFYMWKRKKNKKLGSTAQDNTGVKNDPP